MRDSSLKARAAVLVVFFLSGVAGLIYQVIWVRQFGNAFGNTVHSASLVAGVFMAGLGVGAYVLGRLGDRSFRSDPAAPLRMYAAAEAVVAALGLGLTCLLPRLDVIGATASSYVAGPHGWHVLSFGSYVSRYIVAAFLIVPSTFLMGGTLTLLVRTVVASDVSLAGRRIGALYAANTAGAAVGALLTDLSLVPALGVSGTQLIAVGINAVAAVAAAALVPRLGTAPAVRPEQPHVHEEAEGADRGAVIETAVALALGGFAAMGFEILWFRVLSSALGERRAVFSLLLAVILACIGLGSLLGAWLHARWGRPAILLLAAECLVGVTAALLLGLLEPARMALGALSELKPVYDAAPGWERPLLEVWSSLRPIAAFVAVPSVLMGASFPLANASIQRVKGAVGARAGLLYLTTCAGNVAGCGLVGFVLLPELGMQRTTLVLASVAAASAVPLYLSARRLEEADGVVAARALAAFGGLAVVTLAGFAALPPEQMVLAGLPPAPAAWRRRVLAIREGSNETVVVTDIPGFFRELLTNGHSMSSTHPKSQRYMRAFAHVPLLQMDDPKSVLVICFGTGTTTEAASLHPSVTRIDVADLSQNVLEHAGWFSASNRDVLSDPRVAVFVNDGRHHLLMQPPGQYDLVTLEPPPIASAGVAALYSREFYRLVRSRLTPRGFVTQWLPAYQIPEETVRAVVRAFVLEFPRSVLLSGADNELILMGTRGPSIAMDVDAVERRLASRPAVREDLGRIELGNLTEIAGMFAASSAEMIRATAGARPVTDDDPSLEYSVRSPLPDLHMPADLFDVTGVEAWCPGCLERVPGLGPYLKLRGAIYASDFFLLTSLSRFPGFDLQGVPGADATVARSPYLQTLLGGRAIPPKRVALANERAGHLEDAVNGFLLARSYDPRDPETYDHLAHLFTLLGKPDVAREALEAAKTLRETRAPSLVP